MDLSANTIVDVGSVKFARKQTTSKYAALLAKAAEMKPTEALVVPLAEGEDAEKASRNLRNRLVRHNKGVKETGVGVRLGLREKDASTLLIVHCSKS